MTKKSKPKLKFVVTHMDEHAVYFTMWETAEGHGRWFRAGRLCLNKPTYEKLWQVLTDAGILLPSELKTEVNDDDFPIEIKTPQSKGLHQKAAGATKQPRDSDENLRQRGITGTGGPTYGRTRAEAPSDRDIEYGG